MTIQRTALTDLTVNFLFADQLSDGPSLRLSPLLGPARLPALGGEEAHQQRQQGLGHRLQRLQAHIMRVSVPRSLQREELEEHLQRGAADQGARRGQQRHSLHCGLHRPRASKPAHHSGNDGLQPLILQSVNQVLTLWEIDSRMSFILR